MSASQNSQPPVIVTAAILVIGDEILSGRTKDKNIGYIAEYLTNIGIELREVRVVPDVTDEIVAALNALRARYTYVFTTGGIGPTHDDITADSVAAAFGVPIDYDPRAVAMMRERFSAEDLNEARMRMTRIPAGAELIANSISKAPGFNIGNVYVMAGVPSVFQVMLGNVLPTLRTGRKLLSRSVLCPFGEGVIGAPLAQIQKENPETVIGSYPKFENGRFSTELVVRGSDAARIDAAIAAIESMMATLEKVRAQ